MSTMTIVLNIPLNIIVILTICVYSCAFQCKNYNNDSVDWFILYKFPRVNSENKLVKKGLAFAYITSDDSQQNWLMSNISINASNSILGHTLQPLYTNKLSMYILYNDEPPLKKTDIKNGHTKGLLLSNDSLGLWLIHSVPHFPLYDRYEYPVTGLHYGQSFLCISLNLDDLNIVGGQLQYNQPHIYKFYMSTLMKQKLPNLKAVTDNTFIIQPPWFNLQKFNSSQNVQFASFAKSRKFGKELYADWVAQSLNTNLFVETWLNGPGRIPSVCNMTQRVYNIETIKFALNVSFQSSLDHSKWAVSNVNDWICIGDINRELTQKRRGGGTVCMSNSNVWYLFHSIISNIEKCN